MREQLNVESRDKDQCKKRMSGDEQDKSVEGQTVTTSIVTGMVKWFNVKNCYGFITRSGTNENIFMHQTAMIKNNPRKYLRSVGDGETVEFTVIQGAKGPEAAQVTGPQWKPSTKEQICSRMPFSNQASRRSSLEEAPAGQDCQWTPHA